MYIILFHFVKDIVIKQTTEKLRTKMQICESADSCTENVCMGFILSTIFTEYRVNKSS